jgi:hypothetical protein
MQRMEGQHLRVSSAQSYAAQLPIRLPAYVQFLSHVQLLECKEDIFVCQSANTHRMRQVAGIGSKPLRPISLPLTYLFVYAIGFKAKRDMLRQVAL